MRKINKVLIGIGIVALIILVAKYYYILGFLLEPIEPLRFSIHNSDINKHTVTVEIFDSYNKSLFKETYIVNPREPIFSPEITKKKGEYNFKVNLDGNIEKIYNAKTDIGRSGVSIWLYDEKVSGSKDPLYIVQAIA